MFLPSSLISKVLSKQSFHLVQESQQKSPNAVPPSVPPLFPALSGLPQLHSDPKVAKGAAPLPASWPTGPVRPGEIRNPKSRSRARTASWHPERIDFAAKGQSGCEGSWPLGRKFAGAFGEPVQIERRHCERSHVGACGGPPVE